MKTKKTLIRNTWAEIDLDAVVNNLNYAKKIKMPGAKIAAVLKANAYGHGAVNVAKVLIENNVDMITVAYLCEALELRRHFPDFPLLVMGYTPDEHLEAAVEKDIRLTIFSLDQARKLSAAAKAEGKKAVVHIKLDTGMNRIGMKVGESTVDTVISMYNLENINLEGIFTHLALRTEETDKSQWEKFMSVIGALEAKGINIPIKHVCDSIGMVLYPEYQLDMVRLGAFIYGVAPMAMGEDKRFLKLPMTLKTRIAQIKEIEKGEGVGYDESFSAPAKTLVGTLSAGYADGYMRCLSNNGEVYVRGKRAPIIGIMCMDQMMIDLTEIPEAKAGDEVVLLGEDEVPLSEIAAKAGTNRNEIISVIGRRVPRVYVRDSKIVDIVDYVLD
ncbi:MAG TPA: alanine racemase [Negativicutes bacterium]|nr:alanine racemase [Negativicutes bacterium]